MKSVSRAARLPARFVHGFRVSVSPEVPSIPVVVCAVDTVIVVIADAIVVVVDVDFVCF